jgi:hypothetical protein
MDRDQLRLELLKLVYKPHEHPDAAVKTAKVLETYVVEAQAKEKPQGQNHGSKK